MKPKAKPFTNQQIKALCALEAALFKCAKAGIVIYGMDDDLTAYRKDNVEALKQDVDQYEALRELIRQGITGINCAYSVDDSGAYGDSGAW